MSTVRYLVVLRFGMDDVPYQTFGSLSEAEAFAVKVEMAYEAAEEYPEEYHSRAKELMDCDIDSDLACCSIFSINVEGTVERLYR